MIKTYAQHYAVSSRIEQIKDAPSGSEAAKELKVLMKLIVEYESGRQSTSWGKVLDQPKDTFRHF